MTAVSPITGPVEWIALAFPGQALNAAIAPALAEIVDSGTVRVLDAAVLHIATDGGVTGGELDDEDGAPFGGADGDVLELLSDDDLAQIAATLQPDTTTLVLLWENRWAAAFRDAVRQVHGTVVAHDRVPRDNFDSAMAAQETKMPEARRGRRGADDGGGAVMRSRPGRGRGGPGLLGTMARTAVLAGTASSVAGRLQARQQASAQQQRESEDARRQRSTTAPDAGARAGVDHLHTQLTKLGELRQAGLLTDEEFA